MVDLLSIVLVFGIIRIGYYLFFSPDSQILGSVFWHSDIKNDKRISLTFDDGPNEPYTSQILNVLGKYNVRATFFAVGQNIARDKTTLKKMFVTGHVIGNHSYNHALLAPILTPSFKNEIDKSQKLIKSVTGKTPALFRPPWFFRQPAMLNYAKKSGLNTITGTFGSYWEVFHISAEQIAAETIKATKPGAILVFHDGYNNKGDRRDETVAALEILIPKLIKAGYEFATVPELLNIRAYQD